MRRISYLGEGPATTRGDLSALGLPESKINRLLKAYPGLRGLPHATPHMVAHSAGLTAKQADRVCAAMRLGVRADHCQDSREARVDQPSEAVAMVRNAIARDPVEAFALLMFDARQRPIDLVIVHRGSLSDVTVHPRDLLRPAVQCGAHSILIAHNHPSGDAEPSNADITLTRRISAAADLLGVPLVDHLVVAPRAWTSFAQRGMM